MGTYIVAAILIIIVGSIIYKMYKNKKSGGSSGGCGCSGGCSGCNCH